MPVPSISAKMTNSPSHLVSVLIPAYNHERWVTECLESVLQQTYQNIEVLVLDDFSPDRTFEIVSAIRDPRLSCSRNVKNLGISRTFNALLEQAAGDFIAFIGSDDCWEPSKLQKQVEFLTANPSFDFCFTEALTLDENSNRGPSSPLFDYQNRTRSEWLLRLFFGNTLNGPSALVRRSVLKRFGLLNTSLRQLQDYDLWVRYLTRGCLFFIINEPLTLYRVTKNSLSNNNSIKTLLLDAWETASVLRNYLSLSVGEFRAIFGSLIEGEALFSQARSIEVAVALVCSKVSRPPYQHLAAHLMQTFYENNQNEIDDAAYHDFIAGLSLFGRQPETK